jgi:hypothetical protein
MVDFVPLMFGLLNGLWVYEDAKSRDWSTERFGNRAWKWGLAAFLVWIVFTPLYLIRRRHHPMVA